MYLLCFYNKKYALYLFFVVFIGTYPKYIDVDQLEKEPTDDEFNIKSIDNLVLNILPKIAAINKLLKAV